MELLRDLCLFGVLDCFDTFVLGQHVSCFYLPAGMVFEPGDLFSTYSSEFDLPCFSILLWAKESVCITMIRYSKAMKALRFLLDWIVAFQHSGPSSDSENKEYLNLKSFASP